MKKIFALLICLMMLLPAALAAEVEESPALSLEEMEMYYATLLEQLKTEGCQITANEQGTFTAQSSAGDIFLSQQTLSDETHVLGARLNVDTACLRGLKVGDTLDMILQLYPNDNPSLTGTYYEATLSFRGAEPEICLGYALRDGQRVQEVTYVVYNWQADGILKAGITYTLDQGSIQQISLFTADELLTAEEVETEINDSAMIQEATEYFAYPSSMNGLELDPFCREDLLFAGLDFYGLTPEKAISVLGAAPVDEWTADSNGAFLRLLQWDSISLVCRYDSSKQFQSVYSLSVNDDVMEGPRGLRIGDYLDTVLFRFRHSEGSLIENGMQLYGDGQNAPYGTVTYGPDADTVTYAVSLDGEVVLLRLTFMDDVLQEMQLLNQ